MKKEKKHIYLDERSKRLLIYLSLLAGAIFLGIQNPDGLWLSIGLGVGILYGLANDWIFHRKKDETQKQAEKVSTEIAETVENKSEKPKD